jgi:hypothetical protein
MGRVGVPFPSVPVDPPPPAGDGGEVAPAVTGIGVSGLVGGDTGGGEVVVVVGGAVVEEVVVVGSHGVEVVVVDATVVVVVLVQGPVSLGETTAAADPVRACDGAPTASPRPGDRVSAARRTSGAATAPTSAVRRTNLPFGFLTPPPSTSSRTTPTVHRCDRVTAYAWG